jgi:hypothetical protein
MAVALCTLFTVFASGQALAGKNVPLKNDIPDGETIRHSAEADKCTKEFLRILRDHGVDEQKINSFERTYNIKQPFSMPENKPL